jgi:hypothetical protein
VQFAGKILGCATPPPGKRGRHFVVGGLESRSAISSAKRASERTREALRARYEGPDFDARPKRRGAKPAVPVAAPRPMPVRRTPEMDGPAWSPPKKTRTVDEAALTEAILAHMDARGIPRSPKGAANIVSALLDHKYPDGGALDTHNKNYRAIFSFFAGAKLPTTNKGTREFIRKGEFTLVPASLWGGSKAEVDKRDAALLGDAYRLLAKSFLRVARQSFGPGEMPIPGQRASIADAVATPSFVPKGATQEVKVYVVRLHEEPGVYAFVVREKDPQHTHGLQGGAMDKLGAGAWQKMLARAVEK